MARRSCLIFLAEVAVVGLVLLGSPIVAQDVKKDEVKKDEVKKDEAKKVAVQQKAAIVANLKKADFPSTTIAESDHFYIATTLTEEKTKSLGAVLDKVVPVARKALQFEEKDEAWKGKLAVYFLPEGRDYRGFMRTVVVTQPGGIHYDIRIDTPFVVDPVEVPAKATEADQFASGAAVVAGAFLKSKGTTAAVPDWLVNGFGRVTAMRAEGTNSLRYQRYKATAKGLANKGAKPTELWAEAKPANAELLANSFAEYLAYGPGAPNFIKLIYGYRPDDNGNAPSAQVAFEAAGWKDMAMLETAWRKWAATGK